VEWRWRRAALRLLVTVLLLGVLLTLLNEETLWRRLADFLADSPEVWGAALLAFVVLHTIGAWKWRLFLGLAGARIGRRQAVRFYGAGLFANLCLPSLIGGDVLRAGLAMSVVKEKDAVLLGSVVDRFADLLSLACIVSVGALLAPGAFGTLGESEVSGKAILITFLSILFGGLLVGLFALRVQTLRRWPRPIGRHLIGVLRAMRAMRRRPLLALGGLSLCVLLQTGFVLVNALVGRAMGLDLDLRLWLCLWPLAKIVAMMPISLGGLGIREFAFAGLVQPFGVEAELAVAQSLVWQGVLVAGGILLGAFALFGRGRRAQAVAGDAGGDGEAR
jgi:uncharacterized membrane protein YbhN (UPF0104 family)